MRLRKTFKPAMLKFQNIGEAGFSTLGLTPLVPLRNVHMLIANPGPDDQTFEYQPRLILVRGLQGSGKSTLAKQLTTVGFRNFEADQFYGNKSFDGKLLKHAHDLCLNLTRRTLQFGQRVVVSNTFTTIKELRPYLLLDAQTMILETGGDWPSIHRISDAMRARTATKWEQL